MKNALAAAAFCAMYSVAPASVAQDTIKVGVIGVQSGPAAVLGVPVVETVVKTLEDINANGGLGDGILIEPIVLDSECDPEKAAQAFRKAIEVEKVVSIIGPTCSIAGLSAYKVSKEHDILAIAPSNTSPRISELDDNDLFFRTVPSAEVQISALSHFLNKYHIKKVAVAYIDDEYGQSLFEEFSKSFGALGGEVVSHASKAGAEDYIENLAKLSENNADAFVMIDYGTDENIEMLNQAIDKDLFNAYFTTEAFKSQKFIDGVGEDNHGALFTIGFSPESSYSEFAVASFLDSIDKSIEETFVPQSYDAAFLMALALERQIQSGHRLHLKKALREVSSAPGTEVYPGEWSAAKTLIQAGYDVNYVGAVGEHDFTAAGDTVVTEKTYHIYNAQSGSFEQIKLK